VRGSKWKFCESKEILEGRMMKYSQNVKNPCLIALGD
jgi:hypothetical protein